MSKPNEKSVDILDVHLPLTTNNYTGDDIKREFKCSGCKRVIKTTRELVAHLKVHKSGLSVKFYKEVPSNPVDDKIDILENLAKDRANIENSHNDYQPKRKSQRTRKHIRNTPKDQVKSCQNKINQSDKSIINNKHSLMVCCKICNKYFKRNGLSAHIKKTHRDIIQGNNIETNYLIKSADNNNVKNEVKNKRFKNQCNLCNRMIKKGGISLHILKSHKNKIKWKIGKNPQDNCSNKSKNMFIVDEDNVNEQRCIKKNEHVNNSSNIKQSGTNIQFENIYSSSDFLDNSFDKEYLLISDDNLYRNYIPMTSYEQGLCDKVEVDSIMYSQEETNIHKDHVDICVLDIYFMDEHSTDYISICKDTNVVSNFDQTSIGTEFSLDKCKLRKSIELTEVENEISLHGKYSAVSSKFENKNCSTIQSISIKKDINDNDIEKVSSLIIVSEFMDLPNFDIPLDVYN